MHNVINFIQRTILQTLNGSLLLRAARPDAAFYRWGPLGSYMGQPSLDVVAALVRISGHDILEQL